MEMKDLKALALCAAKRTAPANFTLETVDEALLAEFKAMTGSVNNFMKNRYDIYEILIDTAEKIVPQAIIDQMGSFCEIKQVGQGQTVMFKRGPIGRNRAKKFLTQVGLSGVYESFRLDNETYTIQMKSIGGAVSLDFERFLDGAETLSDFLQVLTDAQTQGIYMEVQAALMAAATESRMPARNKKVGSWSAKDMLDLVRTVKAYGGGATIFAPIEFIDCMGVDSYVGIYTPASGAATTRVELSKEDMASVHDTGKIAIFRGTPVVEITQGFWDDSNAEKMINPQYAYVLPTGSEKVVKVVLEGETQMYDAVNRDQSIEINSYRKVGVGIVHYNNWGVYKNTDIDASDFVNYSLLGIDTETTDHGYPHWN